MSDRSDEPNERVPDSVSFEHLSSLLDMPLSTVIPEIDLGTTGGLCDLQFILMQIVEKSPSGVNLMQELTLAVYLVNKVRASFTEWQTDTSERRGKFAEVTEEEQRINVPSIERYVRLLKEASALLEPLHAQLWISSAHNSQVQMQEELGRELTDSELVSYLLVGPKCTESLDLDRNAVTRFINKQIRR
jgi:hypothetical protein